MSLRNKIILLFLGLAVVPLLILAGFSYWQAQNLVRASVRAQVGVTAETVLRDVDQRITQIEVAMEEIASSLSGGGNERPLGAVLPDSSEARGPLESAAFVLLTSPSGDRHLLAGELPEERVKCCEGGSSSLIEIERSLGGGSPWESLVVGFWVQDLISEAGRGSDQWIAIVDRRTGRILLSDPPVLDDTGTQIRRVLSRVDTLSEPGGFVDFEAELYGEDRVGGLARPRSRDWAVVATAAPLALIPPLSRMVMGYWVFVMGLGVTTSVAFSILLGRFTRSLQELARAAEEIGVGELDPWLPLPSSGEVGQLTLAFSRMLARIRHMMTQVDQNGRLAVVGQLSAFLAHEIRNPLSSIKLNLQRLRRWTKNGSIPEFCLEPLEISLKEVERLSASVSGVLELSASHTSPKEIVGLNGLVAEASDLLSARFHRQGVFLTLDLDADADRVLARSGQLKGVILNLMVNALEAQPQGGGLTIRSELSRSSETGGPVVALHFKDEGGGIPKEIRDRVFEPFFTTKPGGSGIGLAMAIQSVRDNGGELHLVSPIGEESGAEFIMVLPLAAVGPDSGFRGKGVQEFPDLLPREGGGGSDHTRRSEGTKPPPQLMTPEGLRALLSLTSEDPEGGA